MQPTVDISAFHIVLTISIFSSLNTERRREELFQVSCENKAILQRLRACESDYRRQRWQEDWKKVEHQRDDIARYPRELAKKK